MQNRTIDSNSAHHHLDLFLYVDGGRVELWAVWGIQPSKIDSLVKNDENEQAWVKPPKHRHMRAPTGLRLHVAVVQFL